MDTLAYLHLVEDYENPEVRELDLNGLKNKAAIGALGVAAAVGVLSMADSASACGYYGCYPRHYGHHQRYYSYHYYRPVYYSYRHYYRPCY